MTRRLSAFPTKLAVAAMTLGCVTSAPASPMDTAATTLCTPTAVAHFDARVHVRCSVPVSGIVYFVAPISNNNRVE